MNTNRSGQTHTDQSEENLLPLIVANNVECLVLFHKFNPFARIHCYYEVLTTGSTGLFKFKINESQEKLRGIFRVIANCSSIIKFSLLYTNMDTIATVMEFINMLKINKSIKHLGMESVNVDDIQMYPIVDCISHGVYESICLSNMSLSCDSLVNIFCKNIPECNPGLQSLILTDCRIPSSSTEMLRDMILSLPSLNTLNLSCNRINAKSLGFLLEIVTSNNPNLKSIDLSSNLFNDIDETFDASEEDERFQCIDAFINALEENCFIVDFCIGIGESKNRIKEYVDRNKRLCYERRFKSVKPVR